MQPGHGGISLGARAARPHRTACHRNDTAMRRPTQTARALRFTFLERVLLPLLAPLGRALVATWRVRESPLSPAALADVAAAPRAVVGVCHGMLLHAVALSRLPGLRDRRFVVLLSPSRDGRLLAAFLAGFGIGHAVGVRGARAVAGGHDFARRVAAGEIGVVGIDGPRGPRGQVTDGWLRLATAADAVPYLLVTSASPGHTFGSWDRAHLPAPFANLHTWLEPEPSADIAAIQTRMNEAGQLLSSTVLQP